MWCIFCQNDSKPSAEHIIPESVGGSVIIYQVCKLCNSILGTEVDADLNRHRHIYDAYRKTKSSKKPQLRFNFISSSFESGDGIEIKLVRNSLSDKIQPTETAENQFIIDPKDNKFVINYMKKKGTLKGFSGKYIEDQIAEYLRWAKSKKADDSYVNESFELQVNLHSNPPSPRKTTMSGTTPHRFLAKACVEFAFLFGIQNQIENIETLKKHALYGTELNSISCNDEQVWDKAIPYHIITFFNNQFQIHFFGCHGFAVHIQRDSSFPNFTLANDIINKVLLVCQYEEDGVRITNQALKFIWDPKIIEEV